MCQKQELLKYHDNAEQDVVPAHLAAQGLPVCFATVITAGKTQVVWPESRCEADNWVENDAIHVSFVLDKFNPSQHRSYSSSKNSHSRNTGTARHHGPTLGSDEYPRRQSVVMLHISL